MMMPTQYDTRIAKLLQSDIPLSKTPYKDMGVMLDLEENLIIRTIKDMKKQGLIRKFGAIVGHQRAGYTNNAMVIWAVPPSQCEAVGNLFTSYPEITHCYERTPPFEGKYNIFCMVHFGETGREALIQKMSDAASVQDYKILISEKEFKKSSMEYF
ncbi:MAG: Lrp/AsnC family transcriptional regulator [Deltaproteobacteria bacterium]|nr:Lrp/AsnC family transcriptional regulator [Deltaproteobacteria bacterium]